MAVATSLAARSRSLLYSNSARITLTSSMVEECTRRISPSEYNSSSTGTAMVEAMVLAEPPGCTMTTAISGYWESGNSLRSIWLYPNTPRNRNRVRKE